MFTDLKINKHYQFTGTGEISGSCSGNFHAMLFQSFGYGK
jgi:hypothetical protein